ncbi:hypothetical protein INS49_008712 [Diaporthe citri]|uniref:uncharacterized protein n=1 Tax=Diaporthe citri TaxID=83186 RepID=UPI001C8122D2|nr:uncharacterized protein INS49_008712 [Diaporthe citri]KAG6363611.1 hypothetical protein INS49_008712 [Diaporthe citri]
MFHIFRKQLSDDYHPGLEDMSTYYRRILSDLETSRLQVPSKWGLSNYSEVIKAFDRVRWSFFTVRLSLNMSFTVSHASAILPFCYRKVINDKGGTATVCLYGIEQALVEDPALRKALEPSKQESFENGICYELAVKSYMQSMKPIYDIESQAFPGIRGVQGVVQYLGEYQIQHPTINCPDAPSHHIMLEYGELDLDEYLAETYPPVLNAEIRQFWEELFSVARTLERIQNLEYDNRDGKRQHYRGQVLDLVDNYMLLPNPEKRLMMGELCERLDGIIILSEKEYQRNLDMTLLRQIGPETLNALQELDNKAPVKAVTAYEAGAGAGAEMNMSGRGLSPAEAADDKPERSTRVRKSERFDKIVFAKTANRVQHSHSIPGISEGPVQSSERTEPRLDSPVPRDNRRQQKIPGIRLHSSDSPITDDARLPE